MSNSSATSVEPAVVAAARRQHDSALRSFVADVLRADPGKTEAVLDGTWRALAREAESGKEVADAVWLFAEAHRRAVAVQRGAPSPQEEEAAAVDDGPDSRFAQLTPKQHEVLRLKFAHGFSNAEIARIVDLGSLQEVRMLHNALMRLAPAFRGPESPPVVAVDDPRLTLAALGEMDRADWQAWGAAQSNPAATNERLEEIRRAAAWVKEHFAAGGRRRTAADRRWRHWTPWVVRAVLPVLALVWWFFGRPSSAGERGAPAAGEVAARGVAVQRAAPADRREHIGADEDVRSLGVYRDHTGGRTGGDGKGPLTAAESATEAPAAKPGGPRTAEDETSADPRPRPPAASSRGHAAHLRGLHGQVGLAAAAAEREGHEAASRRTGGKASVTAGASPSAPTADGEGAASGQARENAARARRVGPEAGDAPRAPVEPPAAGDATERAIRDIDLAPITALKRALGSGRWPRPEEVSRAALRRHFARPPRSRVGADLFALEREATTAPWLAGKIAVRVAAQARMGPAQLRPPATVVLLLDASGSMVAANRWPLVVEAVGGLIDRLLPTDEVGIVAYADGAKVLLPPGPLRDRWAVRAALQSIEPAGLTNGGAGLEEAFALARGADSRRGERVVILCTDGNFNMGRADEGELLGLVARHAEMGIRLAAFGFGRTDRVDPRLAELSRVGAGGSGFVNTRSEAISVFFRQIGGLIDAIAESVELEVEVDGDWRAGAAAAAVLPGETLAAIVAVAPGQPVIARLRAEGESRGEAAWDGRVSDIGDVSEEFRFELAVERLAELLAAPPDGAGVKLAELERWTWRHIGLFGGYREELLTMIGQARAATGVQAP